MTTAPQGLVYQVRCAGGGGGASSARGGARAACQARCTLSFNLFMHHPASNRNQSIPCCLCRLQGAGATEDAGGKVGEIDRGGHGFAVGTAPSDAKPPGDSSPHFRPNRTLG